jgi:hypothetical protein
MADARFFTAVGPITAVAAKRTPKTAAKPKRPRPAPKSAGGEKVLSGGGIGGLSGGPSNGGGGNIASASGITAGAAVQAMRRSGDGPAQEEPPPNETIAGSGYPRGWLLTNREGRVI